MWYGVCVGCEVCGFKCVWNGVGVCMVWVVGVVCVRCGVCVGRVGGCEVCVGWGVSACGVGVWCGCMRVLGWGSGLRHLWHRCAAHLYGPELPGVVCGGCVCMECVGWSGWGSGLRHLWLPGALCRLLSLEL